MKYVLWAIGGLIAISVLISGVGAYWATSVPLDFKDPVVAGNYKETFNANCVATYKQRVNKAGKTFADSQFGNLDQACTCWRDGVMAALAKREPMTAMQIGTLLTSDADLKAIALSCSAQFGIDEPL